MHTMLYYLLCNSTPWRWSKTTETCWCYKLRKYIICAFCWFSLATRLLTFGTFYTKYLHIKTLKQMCETVPTEYQDIPHLSFPKSYPTLITSQHSPLLHRHLALQSAVSVKEEVSWVLFLATISRWCAEGRWGFVGCSLLIHIGTSFIICRRISSMMPSHIRKTRATNM
jgi:hypothetical protein